MVLSFFTFFNKITTPARQAGNSLCCWYFYGTPETSLRREIQQHDWPTGLVPVKKTGMLGGAILGRQKMPGKQFFYN
jgi:hypothetical protein